MKLVVVNGSPRKKWNTGQLMEKVVDGAQAAGADANLVHLYDLDYTGCTSCFACKRLGGASYGRCAMRDGLTPLLDEIHNADALVMGSPIYLMAETGETRSFMERLGFQYLRYANPPATLFPRRIQTALVYTMNVDDEQIAATGLRERMGTSAWFFEMVFGASEMLFCTDTLQFPDYSMYDNTRFDPDAKMKRHREIFPQDLERAFDLGKRMAEPLAISPLNPVGE